MRKIADPAAPGDTLLLCKSEGRREKESQKRLYETWGIDWQALPTLITRRHCGQTTTGEPSIL